MTFRTRVIAATVAAAAIAVIIACFASYFTTRSALFNSVDQSLVQASKQPLNSHLDDRLIGASSKVMLEDHGCIPHDRGGCGTFAGDLDIENIMWAGKSMCD